MKKSTLLFTALIALLISSCKPCVQCTDCALGTSGEICRKDYDSKEDYQDAIDAAENVGGCNCK